MVSQVLDLQASSQERHSWDAGWFSEWVRWQDGSLDGAGRIGNLRLGTSRS